MTRSMLACLSAAALVAGCVTVIGPTTPPANTPAPSSAPTNAPTGAPTATPSAAPTLAPTDAPTAAPTSAPTAAPTEQPSDFDTRDVLFEDDLSDPTGTCSGPLEVTPAECFAVGDVTSSDGERIANVAYGDGALHVVVDHPNGWMLSPRAVDGAHSTMRIAAQFLPTADGRFGLLCQRGDDPAEQWGAAVGTDGSWVLGDVGETGINALAEGASAVLAVPLGGAVAMAIECSGRATGGLRLTLWMENTGPIATLEVDEGPDNFDRAAIYAQAMGEPTAVDVQDVITFGTGYGDGQMTDNALELMAHVPEDWADTCYQSVRPPLFGSIAEAIVTCFIREPGAAGAEIAEYVSYVSTEEMNDGYQKRVDAFGAGSASSCADGSGEHAWWIGDDQANTIGRILCTDQLRGIRFDWTDERLNIMGSLVDFDGDYALTLTDWEAAGPNP